MRKSHFMMKNFSMDKKYSLLFVLDLLESVLFLLSFFSRKLNFSPWWPRTFSLNEKKKDLDILWRNSKFRQTFSRIKNKTKKKGHLLREKWLFYPIIYPFFLCLGKRWTFFPTNGKVFGHCWKKSYVTWKLLLQMPKKSLYVYFFQFRIFLFFLN